MTAKQFVQEQYPQANHEKYKHRGALGKTYYIIWNGYARGRDRLGEGDTISKAWTDAKNNILESQQENK